MSAKNTIQSCKVCGSTDLRRKFRLPEFEIWQCRNCSVVFLPAMPDSDELKKLYSQDYYQEREEYFFQNIVADRERGVLDENIKSFQKGLTKIDQRKPGKGKLLDIGCGPGIFLEMAKREGWQVTGVDVSSFAAQYAKDTFNITVHVSTNLHELALPEKSYDVITLWDALEHFSDPLEELREIHRLLKADGILVLDVPNEDSLLRVLARFLYNVSFRKFTYPVRKLYHEYHLHYFGRQALTMLLEQAGFIILNQEQKTIPVVKARGKTFEKKIIRLFSWLEKLTGMEYELLITAGKKHERKA